MTNTALRAENSNSRTITFKSREHEKFYEEYLKKCRYQDVYHRALVYCLGIDRDTRNNVNKIYNFKTGCVKTECLQEGWQTSGSLRIVRMAFNLYCNGTPSVGDYEAEEDQLKECQCYTVEDLFCCGYARYFWEAIKISYPESVSYTHLTCEFKIKDNGTGMSEEFIKNELFTPFVQADNSPRSDYNGTGLGLSLIHI